MANRNLNLSMDTLFPRETVLLIFCDSCDSSTEVSNIQRAFEIGDNGKCECGGELEHVTPTENDSICRVCDSDVVDGRWNYCSVRCREIANWVQQKFIWSNIRESVLERDGYTCQICGIDKNRWHRAYHQTLELIKDRNDIDRQNEYQKWLDQMENLEDRYLFESIQSGGFHVDHITPISDDGHRFDEENLQTLCKYCHVNKTSSENSSGDGQ